jgi:hypothetical protein
MFLIVVIVDVVVVVCSETIDVTIIISSESDLLFLPPPSPPIGKHVLRLAFIFWEEIDGLMIDCTILPRLSSMSCQLDQRRAGKVRENFDYYPTTAT